MPTEIQKPQKYVDLPELSEVFADGIRVALFDGYTFRFEFTTTRPRKEGDNFALDIYPVARLALSPSSAVELRNKLSEVISILEKQGTLRLNVPSSGTKQ
jgi:hypothetical protein